jgi:uncharacterized membrane protein YjfL (UPF0719 family)
MKKSVLSLIVFAACYSFPTILRAAEPAAPTATAATSWHAQTLVQALANVAIFAIVGTLLAIVYYKLFDKCTPGDINREIVEHRNVAAAIVAGAVILGVCIIIAAAMVG